MSRKKRKTVVDERQDAFREIARYLFEKGVLKEKVHGRIAIEHAVEMVVTYSARHTRVEQLSGIFYHSIRVVLQFEFVRTQFFNLFSIKVRTVINACWSFEI